MHASLLSSGCMSGHDPQLQHPLSPWERQSRTTVQVTTAKAGELLEEAPADTEYEASSFSALKLSRPLLKACAELGYTVPTAVQVRCSQPRCAEMALYNLRI